MTPVRLSTSVSQDENGAHVTVRTPDKYTGGEIALTVRKNDGTVEKTVTVTPENGSAVVDLKLASGIYIFTSELDGKPYGTQTVCTVM